MVTPTDHQWKAIKETSRWFLEASKAFRHDPTRTPVPGLSSGQSFVFAGYAGSGKSTCVGAVIEELRLRPSQVMYMAPTGKAARVLTNKLSADGWDTPATTIHKAVYMPLSQKSQEVRDEIKAVDTEYDNRVQATASGEYRRTDFEDMDDHQLQVHGARLTKELKILMRDEELNFTLKGARNLPEDVRIMVVDEASMVGEGIVDDLASFGIPILAIGDPGQLPPVKGSWGFHMDSPDVFLTEIHRQASENPIIQLATMAREGELIRPGKYGDTVEVIRRQNDNATYDTDRDAMVLVGTHNKRYTITTGIRKELGITSTGPVEGEPILVQRNSRTYQNLVNGTLTTCMEDVGDLVEGGVSIHLKIKDNDVDGMVYNLTCPQCFFEEHHQRKQKYHSGPTKAVYDAIASQHHLDWGHAITVHKAQGSEWDDVILHDESGAFRDQGNRWLYTGITRAAEKLTLVI